MNVTAPDTPIALAAQNLAREVSSLALLNHCERTYAFAAALADKDALDVDHETLYLGSILHDLGLTERFDGPEEFERQGADAARAFLVGKGYPEPDADLVHHAITLHTRVGTEDHERPEVPLLRLGAGIDVLGLGIEDVPPGLVEEIVAAWPREGLKAELVEAFRSEAERKPDSWTAMLVGHLDWLQRIEDAPFSE